MKIDKVDQILTKNKNKYNQGELYDTLYENKILKSNLKKIRDEVILEKKELIKISITDNFCNK